MKELEILSISMGWKKNGVVVFEYIDTALITTKPVHDGLRYILIDKKC